MNFHKLVDNFITNRIHQMGFICFYKTLYAVRTHYTRTNSQYIPYFIVWIYAKDVSTDKYNVRTHINRAHSYSLTHTFPKYPVLKHTLDSKTYIYLYACIYFNVNSYGNMFVCSVLY